MCPLSRRTYILDVASEMAQVDGGYALWFRRVLWDQPLKFDNELYVTMHYNQVRACGCSEAPESLGSPRLGIRGLCDSSPEASGPHVGMSSPSLPNSQASVSRASLLFLYCCWSGPLQPGCPDDTFSGRSDLFPPALLQR